MSRLAFRDIVFDCRVSSRMIGCNRGGEEATFIRHGGASGYPIAEVRMWDLKDESVLSVHSRIEVGNKAYEL